MIDRIETQQSEESQEVKYYKATSFIHAYPQTNFGYIDWANKTTHKASVPVSPGAGKHGFHLIHNKDTAFERHEWVAFADFQNTYHEHNAKSDCDDNKKPDAVITEEDFAELKQTPHSRMTVLSILSPGHGNEPFTPVLISALNDYITALNNNDMGNDSLECVQFGNGYAIKAVHRTSPIQPEGQQGHQQSKPADDKLLNAYNRYMKAHTTIPGDTTSPLTYDEFIDIANIEDWLDGSKDGEPYNRKELDEKFKEKDLRVYTPEYVNSPEYVEYLKSITSYNPTPQPSLGDKKIVPMTNKEYSEWAEKADEEGVCYVEWLPKIHAYIDGIEPKDGFRILVKEKTKVTKSLYGWLPKSEVEQYRAKLIEKKLREKNQTVYTPEYVEYLKSIAKCKPMSQEMFNAGNEITDNLAGSFAKGLNVGAGAGAAIDAASIKSALKTQFDKLKNDNLSNKHAFKLELERTKAMVELAEAINIMDV